MSASCARSRTLLPTAERAALGPSPEAVATDWGQPDRDAPARRARLPPLPLLPLAFALRRNSPRRARPSPRRRIGSRRSSSGKASSSLIPVEEVWAFFGRVEDVAACLPGASLDGGEKDGAVTGKIKVKIGPISAEFGGVAHITRDGESASRDDPGFRPRRAQQLRDALQARLFRQAGRARRRLPR